MVVKTSNGFDVLIDDEDEATFNEWTWWARHDGHTAYVVRGQKQKPRTVYLHRELLRPSAGLEVDHINGDGLDNRRANLRVVTHGFNERNKPARSRTGERCVYFTRHKSTRYCARCTLTDGRLVHLGNYRTLEDAVLARDAAERALGIAIERGR